MIKKTIFIIRNILYSTNMPEFQKIEYENFTIEPCKSEYLGGHPNTLAIMMLHAR